MYLLSQDLDFYEIRSYMHQGGRAKRNLTRNANGMYCDQARTVQQFIETVNVQVHIASY